MLTYEILEEDGIVIIEPRGPLSGEDFRQLTRDVDAFLLRKGRLKGLLIHAQAFPGWDSPEGMMSHLRFVREHHKRIARVALASDSTLLALGPKLVEHFLAAEVRTFAFGEREEALGWLREAPETAES